MKREIGRKMKRRGRERDELETNENISSYLQIKR